MSLPCPEKSKWQEWLAGGTPESERAELTQHLSQCPNCQRLLDEISGGTSSLADALRAGELPAADSPELKRVLDDLKEKQASADVDARTFLQRSDNPAHLGRLDGYEILDEVGRGGMGIVLRAFDPKLQRVVAIKVLAPHLAASAAARQRFLREARAAAAVAHEHVVTIHAVEEPVGRLPYLVMQYVEGRSLQDRLDQSGPLGLKEILRIGMQAASGLAAAHAQGLVHRDIKPANILLENGVERVKLADFGLARAAHDGSLTQSGVVTGSPLFMSPEQARGEAVDHRSDLFSLGTVLYTMCAGYPPFRAETPLAVLKRVCDDQPRSLRDSNSAVPDWLEAIIFKLLAKKPGDRVQSAKEVADLLGQHLRHLQQPAAVPRPATVTLAPEPVAQVPRQRRSLVLPLLLILAPLIVLPMLVLVSMALDLRAGWLAGLVAIALSGVLALVGIVLLVTGRPAAPSSGAPRKSTNGDVVIPAEANAASKKSSNRGVWIVVACVLMALFMCGALPVLIMSGYLMIRDVSVHPSGVTSIRAERAPIDRPMAAVTKRGPGPSSLQLLLGALDRPSFENQPIYMFVGSTYDSTQHRLELTFRSKQPANDPDCENLRTKFIGDYHVVVTHGPDLLLPGAKAESPRPRPLRALRSERIDGRCLETFVVDMGTIDLLSLQSIRLVRKGAVSGEQDKDDPRRAFGDELIPNMAAAFDEKGSEIHPAYVFVAKSYQHRNDTDQWLFTFRTTRPLIEADHEQIRKEFVGGFVAKVEYYPNSVGKTAAPKLRDLSVERSQRAKDDTWEDRFQVDLKGEAMSDIAKIRIVKKRP